MNKLVKKVLKKILTDKLKNKISYFRGKVKLKSNFYKVHGYKLNLKSPKTFNEKIQYRKFYGNNQFMAKIADKYLVRNYVKEKLGEEYLIPLLGVYDKIKVSDLKKLPNKFVIKTNHGSGSTHIEIVTDKKSVDLDKLCEKMNRAVKEKFGYSNNQLFYTLIKSKIIIEKYLETGKETPDDFKFHVFKGSNKIILQLDKGRFSEHRQSFFDETLKKLDIQILGTSDIKSQEIENIKNLKQMFVLAKKLGKDFDYIRVDFYNVDGKIYFGELTQTHCGGFAKINPLEWDKELGKYWELEANNKKLYI